MRFGSGFSGSAGQKLKLVSLALAALAFFACSGKQQEQAASPEMGAAQGGMTVEELKAMPKVDAHAHVMGLTEAEEGPFIAKLKEHNFAWLDICTIGTKWDSLQLQIRDAERLRERYPENIEWATSFNLQNWGRPDWQEAAIKTIQEGFDKQAVSVKVWKEIGMVLKDPDGKFVMIDDPRFDPIFDYIQSQGKTLVAHIGEPRNCWLPLDSMTVNNDRKYFADHPEYHSYLHPEIPDFWKQIAARDHVLDKHPNLRVVGCHLGSLEYDVDWMAEHFDKYPNFAVDMAARICHFQVQEREKVRNFMIKYQDRLLYGTDLAVGAGFVSTGPDSTLSTIETTYNKDYKYFATDEEIEVWEVTGKFRGLALPADVLKKIFHDNFRKWYPAS